MLDITNLVERQTVGRNPTTYYENGHGEIVGKRCTKCGQPKALDEFNKDKTKFAGRKSICREDTRKKDKRYYESNRDKKLEYKSWYYDVKLRKEIEW